MNDDRDLVIQLERWLDTREAPVITSRLSEEILSRVATVPQERPLVPRLLRPHARRDVPRLLAVAAALLLALGVIGTVLVGGGPRAALPLPSPSAISSTSDPTPSPTVNPYPELVRRIPLNGDTWQVLASPSRVWVQTGDVGMAGIDATTGKVVFEVPGVAWMVLEGEDLWALAVQPQALLRLDPMTGAVRERFEDVPGTYFAKDGDTIWAPSQEEVSAVIRRDLITGEEVASIPVPAEPKQVIVVEGSVWVICDDGNALVRIDPEVNEVVDTIDVGRGPVELKYGFESLWVKNRDLELVRVDPTTGVVLNRLTGFGGSPSNALSFSGDLVWSSIFSPAGMAAVDPETNETVRRIPRPGATFMDSVWIDDTLWITTAGSRLLLEVDASSP